MIRKTKGTAIISLVLCAFLWSSGGILIKLVSWDAFAISGGRSMVGLLTMLLLVGKPKFTFSFDQIMASLMYSATMILFVFANKMTTSANAVLLQYTEPVYIILFSTILLRDEKTSFWDILVIVGVFSGMVLFFLDDLSFTTNIGNFLALLSGITFALTAIFLRRQKKARPIDSFMLAHLITFIVAIPFMIHAGIPSGSSFVGIMLLGFFQMGLPSILFAWGIVGVSALSSALITMLEPILNPVWVAIFIHEYPSPRAMIGGAIIICCVTVRSIFKKS
jgi:drug/metabolite transporter (DMT)-like permease